MCVLILSSNIFKTHQIPVKTLKRSLEFRTTTNTDTFISFSIVCKKKYDEEEVMCAMIVRMCKNYYDKNYEDLHTNLQREKEKGRKKNV